MVLEYEIIYSEITGIQFSGIVLKEGIWCVAKLNALLYHIQIVL